MVSWCFSCEHTEKHVATFLKAFSKVRCRRYILQYPRQLQYFNVKLKNKKERRKTPPPKIKQKNPKK